MAGFFPQLSPRWERPMREAAGCRVWMTTTTGLRSRLEESQAGFGRDLPALTEGPLTGTIQALLRTDYRRVFVRT